MRRVDLPENAPESWKMSAHYDELELWGSDARSGYVRAYAERRRRTLALVERFCRSGGRILDVAAAQGNYTLALAEQGYDVTWNDLRAELAEYVEKKRTSGAVQFAPGNVFDLKVERPFDLLLVAEVIEHVAHPDQFLQRISHLVADDGFIVVTTPNGKYFRNKLPKFSNCPDPSQFESMQFRPNSDGHIFLLHPDELAELAGRAGLRVRELQVFNNPLTAGALKTGSLLRFLPLGPVEMLDRVTSRLPRMASRLIHLGMIAVLDKAQR